jgi:glutamine synthetase
LLLETDCMIDMVSTGVIPAILKDFNNSSLTVSKLFDNEDTSFIKNKKHLYQNIIKENEILKKMYSSINHDQNSNELAEYCAKVLKPQAELIRLNVDLSEKVCDRDLWPYPKYENMLFQHHYHGKDEFFK